LKTCPSYSFLLSAKKPFIHGDVLDEGTVYPTPVPMETVEDMWALFENDYLNKDSTWISNEDTKATILALYPADPAEGSPFGTKEETFGYGLTFKRAAALYGGAYPYTLCTMGE
jgi:hypothetical protein